MGISISVLVAEAVFHKSSQIGLQLSMVMEATIWRKKSMLRAGGKYYSNYYWVDTMHFQIHTLWID